LAHQFFAPVAEEPLALSVYQGDVAGSVDDDDSVGRRLDNHAKPFLRLPDLLFGATPSCPLYQEANDQQRLDGAKGENADNVPPVHIPETRVPKADDAAGREVRFVNAPALQLAPIEHVGAGSCFSGGQVFGLLADQDPQPQACGVSRFDLETAHEPTDDAVPEVGVVISVDGDVRRLVDLVKRFTGD